MGFEEIIAVIIFFGFCYFLNREQQTAVDRRNAIDEGAQRQEENKIIRRFKEGHTAFECFSPSPSDEAFLEKVRDIRDEYGKVNVVYNERGSERFNEPGSKRQKYVYLIGAQNRQIEFFGEFYSSLRVGVIEKRQYSIDRQDFLYAFTEKGKVTYWGPTKYNENNKENLFKEVSD